MIAQILGVSISSIYFFNLIRVYKVKILIEKYLEIAFLISIASIPMFYLGINVFSSDRLGLGNSYEGGESITLGLDYKKEKINSGPNAE